MKKIKVVVTAQDIKKGDRHSPETCPVALAAKRASNGLIIRAVGDFFRLKDETTVTNTSKRAQSFIFNFDHGRPVKPFSFTISV